MNTQTRCQTCGGLANEDARCPNCDRPKTRPASRFPLMLGGVLGLGLLIAGTCWVNSHPPGITDAPLSSPTGPPVVQASQRPLGGPPVLASPLRPLTGPPVVEAPSHPTALAPSVMQAPRPVSGPPVVSAPAAPAEPPLTQAAPPPPAPALTETPPPPRPSPIVEVAAIPVEDPNKLAVLAYLKKMEAVEANRKQVVTNLLPGLMTLTAVQGMMGRSAPEPQEGQGAGPGFDPTSLHEAQNTFTRYRSQMEAIEGQVRKIRPPGPARAFHQSYLSAMGSYSRVVEEITAAMMHLDSSLSQKVGSLQRRAEEPLASADRQLDTLLKRYDLERTFNVGDGN